MNEMSRFEGWQACSNCVERYKEHAGDKCLYDATWFEEARCIGCNMTCDVYDDCIILNATNYFVCADCYNTYCSSDYGPGEFVCSQLLKRGLL